MDHRKSIGSDAAFQQPNPPYPQSYDPTDYNDYYQPHQPYQPQQPQPAAQPSYNTPAYKQPFQTPAYAENETTANAYDQGYASRAGNAQRTSLPASKPPSRNLFGFMSSKWAAMFMATTAIQAVVCLCFEAYIFAKFQSSLRDRDQSRDLEDLDSQYKTIPTFLTLFIFGFLYELIVVWDALRKKNTIQIIGVCFANLALVIYTGLQVDQIQLALGVLWHYNSLIDGFTYDIVWEAIRSYLIAIPAVIALVTCCMVFLTWKLYQEFAWDILKIIGADYRMKKRFLHYQIYIALLKFDFFFFLGFIIQLIVIVTKTSDPEFALTIVTIPITIVILVSAGYFTRIENKAGMIVTIVLYFGGLTYFLFKLVRIWTWKSYYEAVQKSLTAFAAITVLLIILTIANAIICMRNFNMGLKTHILQKKEDDHPEANSVNLTDAKPQPSRMTID